MIPENSSARASRHDRVFSFVKITTTTKISLDHQHVHFLVIFIFCYTYQLGEFLCILSLPTLASKAFLYFGDSKVTHACASEKHVPSCIIHSGTTAKFKNGRRALSPSLPFLTIAYFSEASYLDMKIILKINKLASEHRREQAHQFKFVATEACKLLCYWL